VFGAEFVAKYFSALWVTAYLVSNLYPCHLHLKLFAICGLNDAQFFIIGSGARAYYRSKEG
jgi:hypothetical protein